MLSTPRLFDLRVPGHALRECPADSLVNTLRAWCAATMMMLMLMVLAPHASAQLIETTEARIEYQDGGFDLAASFDFDLPPALEDALHKGISLYFVVDFQLTRPRWYWFDEKPVNTMRTVRISYQPLTRQYRVSTGGLQLPFSRLKSALQFIQQVRGWRVFERNQVRLGETYHAETRMRLDLSQLPKPFQINAVNTREWNLSSEWKRFNYTVPTNLDAPPPPAPVAPPPVAPPAPPAMPGSSPTPASAVSAEPRTQFSQTLSNALSTNQLVQPVSQP
ncbi:DUF4390 domain-containing protein [Cupriavidus metallidurans]|uniref:DUF4390 domain-containing protein n=1 Tax=Cupriavidus TaxID=106589 RepID=UPI0002A28040|nr:MULTISPECIES: DUF4390 domain-containing protein [unclassified Cupriavidus]ELA01368.1 hypothetical protein D769_00685 [Cupriavidus sp. HMR-1]GMG91798.1 hypothetical protein Cmtc_30180 [Cupriavidus sp. TKC]HBD35590.1 DUF4390 domain-containing protein [Cupriavidus sp.]HBO80899.1 DUF4390 domain-containing protein [Cupriavidus sp.]